MSKHNKHIPLAQFLEDKDSKRWIDNIIGILVEKKHQSSQNNERPIGMIEFDFQSEESGLIKIDLGIELLEKTDASAFIRIGTGVLGIDSVQEEVYVEVTNEELKVLSPSLLESFNLKPLVQEAYDRCKEAQENKKIFNAR